MSGSDSTRAEFGKWTREFAMLLGSYGSFVFAVLFMLGYTPEATEFFRTHRALGVISIGVSYILFIVHKLGTVEQRIIEERRRELEKEVDK